MPGPTSVPAGGFCSTTLPTGASANTCATGPTPSPAAASVTCAAGSALPARSGTGITRRPRDSTRSTTPPRLAIEPGPGRCSSTRPGRHALGEAVGAALMAQAQALVGEPLGGARRARGPTRLGTGVTPRRTNRLKER